MYITIFILDIELTENSEIKESSNTTDTTTATTGTAKPLNVKSNSLNLKSILRNLIEWITQSAVSSQMLRINLYTSFLNCANIILGQDYTQQQATEAMIETNEEYETVLVFFYKLFRFYYISKIYCFFCLVMY